MTLYEKIKNIEYETGVRLTRKKGNHFNFMCSFMLEDKDVRDDVLEYTYEVYKRGPKRLNEELDKLFNLNKRAEQIYESLSWFEKLKLFSSNHDFLPSNESFIWCWNTIYNFKADRHYVGFVERTYDYDYEKYEIREIQKRNMKNKFSNLVKDVGFEYLNDEKFIDFICNYDSEASKEKILREYKISNVII